MTAASPLTKPHVWVEIIRDTLAHLENKMRLSSQMGNHSLDAAVDLLILAGGKRIRPAITLLTGEVMNAMVDNVVSVAASVELLHTATLVHDDLIDGAAERRGVPTLHSHLPAGITVLTGDFLFARSAALAAESDNVRVVRVFAETLVRICRGEILQAQTRWKIPTYEIYIDRIYGKTAALFEAASTSSAILGGASEAQIDAMARYGHDLGLAFQIMDDALDFVSTTQQLGKPAGNDMCQGIYNLPLMYFAEQGKITEAALNERVRGNLNIEGLLEDIRRAHVVEQSLDVARDYARQAAAALDIMPQGEQVEALRALAQYAVAREF